ncbi:vacuolar iron transporter homolog 1-like [Abrus precatorius]|uniref:Vacuolar iron transporter n=1 Tax=Abrus precatorius TaxID=3816 RepID=A0A8B8KUT4_ABRPR|nr:vacuolar iron transporter homolog 1-like [Abrus precatorius]
MASLGISNNEMSFNHIEIPIHSNDIESELGQVPEEKNIDYSQRAQWLHASVLRANDGLVSVTSLMMCVGALTEDITTMLLAGFAGLVAGACTMAIGGFISVYTQLDIEIAQMKSEREINNNKEKEVEEDEKLANPFQANIASAIAFSVGAVVPLLAAAFIRDYKIRLAFVAALASLALLIILGKTLVRSYGQSVEWRLDDYGYYFWL